MELLVQLARGSKCSARLSRRKRVRSTFQVIASCTEPLLGSHPSGSSGKGKRELRSSSDLVKSSSRTSVIVPATKSPFNGGRWRVSVRFDHGEFHVQAHANREAELEAGLHFVVYRQRSGQAFFVVRGGSESSGPPFFFQPRSRLTSRSTGRSPAARARAGYLGR